MTENYHHIGPEHWLKIDNLERCVLMDDKIFNHQSYYMKERRRSSNKSNELI